MREKVKDKGRLEHILQACNDLLASKDKYTFDAVKDDPIIFYGFVKLAEIIGEASYMLTKEFRAKHTEIPWEQMIGLRHVLVHGYYTIKPKQLWNIIEKDVPILISRIKQLLDSEKLTKRINKSKAWQ